MAYKVLSKFLENDHEYKEGDSYPAEGVEVEEERFEYLSSKKKNGAVSFIEKINEGHVGEESNKTEVNVFKGVQAATLRKALEGAAIEIPENADRDSLIQLMIENELTV